MGHEGEVLTVALTGHPEWAPGGSASDAMKYKGNIDASGNPNYPAATAGWVYGFSSDGKIGGVNGTAVKARDSMICQVDTVAGDQAAVGDNWDVLDNSVTDAVAGPISSTNGNIVLFDGTSGRVIKDGGVSASSFQPASASIVMGPASAVDGRLSAFDTTTGKLLKDSGFSAADLARTDVKTIGPSGSTAKYVCTGTADQTTFATAVAAMSAGDVLIILPGTYNFTAGLGIDKQITVVGSGEATVIKSIGNTSLFYLQASGISMDSVSFNLNTAQWRLAISVNAVTNINITNCVITDVGSANCSGFEMGSCSQVTVEGCRVIGNMATGFYISNGASRITIYNCHVEVANRGVLFDGSVQNGGFVIDDCFLRCDYPVYQGGGGGNGVDGLVISRNTIRAGICGVYLDTNSTTTPSAARNVVITANKFSDSEGSLGKIVLKGTSNININANTFGLPIAAGAPFITIAPTTTAQTVANCVNTIITDNSGDASLVDYAIKEADANQSYTWLANNKITAGSVGFARLLGAGSKDADSLILGSVQGPASATDGAIPLFDTATGKLVKNSAYTPASFAAASHAAQHAAGGGDPVTLTMAQISDLAGNLGGGLPVTFTNASLSTGVLTVTHNLGVQYMHVSVIDNTGAKVIPDQIYYDSTSALRIDLTGQGTLTGTWVALIGNSYPGENLIRNGDFEVAQRGTTFAAATAYTLDGHRYAHASDAVVTITQDTDVPTLAQSGHQSRHSLKIQVTTADSSIGSDQLALFMHKIEGYDIYPAVGKNVTISFWMKAKKTGVYSLSLRNGEADRSMVKEVTVSSADTWEKKSVTVAMNYSGGTWDYTTGVGLVLSLALACGSTYQTTKDVWQSSNYVATSSQVNALDSTNNYINIAQLKFEIGQVASAFVPAPYQQELARCMRYLRVYGRGTGGVNVEAAGVGYVSSSGGGYVFISFEPMRATPTLSCPDVTLFRLQGYGFAIAVSAMSLETAFGSIRTAAVDITVTGSGTAPLAAYVGHACILGANASATSVFYLTAEL